MCSLSNLLLYPPLSTREDIAKLVIDINHSSLHLILNIN